MTEGKDRHPILLAVDPGGRKSGLARCGRAGLVSPEGIITTSSLGQLAAEVASRLDALGAEACVIGLPLDGEGEPTGACRRSRALGGMLEEMGRRIHYQPEYLTTREARQRAREIGRNPSAPVDDLAAVIILEDFLAACAREKPDHD